MPIRSDAASHRRSVRIHNASAFAVLCSFVVALAPRAVDAQSSQSTPPTSTKEKVIIDTDIGIGIDDAFAVALALCSPEMDVLGFSTASGDTAARARIIDRMLDESGRRHISVAAGVATQSSVGGLPPALIGLQARYGDNWPFARTSRPAATDFILEKVRQFPGEITLVTIGPLSNVGALIDKDVGTFRKLKRVVMMGGWIGRIEDIGGQEVDPVAEYNVRADVPAAQKLFRSGVPVYVIPIDSTKRLALDEVRRKAIFSQGTPITDGLVLLYTLSGYSTPTLYDPMAVAFTIDPELCPVEPMHLIVDDKGFTRTASGPPNAQVCLRSNANAFLDYYVQRIVDGSKSLSYSSRPVPVTSHASGLRR